MISMSTGIIQERVEQGPVYVQMFKAAGWIEPSNGKIRKAILNFFRRFPAAPVTNLGNSDYGFLIYFLAQATD